MCFLLKDFFLVFILFALCLLVCSMMIETECVMGGVCVDYKSVFVCMCKRYAIVLLHTLTDGA